ncbi:MAG: hypothetical protein COZ05_23015 [Armatimonadetes bacterium CG_4_10_14_3_um_filter_59_10]|nr:MAG: hypothetical protein COZ05_23015 [Armatimonadetes bacterium CG_4_10_14_3_um_filter_59_10]
MDIPLNHYHQRIKRILACSDEDALKICVVMQDDVLHTVALDWLTASAFEQAAREAQTLLEANREVYEEYFTATRAIFEESRAAKAAAA